MDGRRRRREQGTCAARFAGSVKVSSAFCPKFPPRVILRKRPQRSAWLSLSAGAAGCGLLGRAAEGRDQPGSAAALAQCNCGCRWRTRVAPSSPHPLRSPAQRRCHFLRPTPAARGGSLSGLDRCGHGRSESCADRRFGMEACDRDRRHLGRHRKHRDNRPERSQRPISTPWFRPRLDQRRIHAEKCEVSSPRRIGRDPCLVAPVGQRLNCVR